MDTTSETTWWSCPDCGGEAELQADTTTDGCRVPCPDCGGCMAEQWQWDAAA